MSLKDDIKAEAYKLGFVLCGVTPAVPPPHFPAYQEWIQAGRQAGMAYLARPDTIAARKTPQHLLEGCQSILCVGLPYPPPQPAPAVEPGKSYGRIATYATLPDYHKVMGEKLNLLAALLGELTNSSIRTAACVDTAPILEKDYAALSGLGWIGRNSLLFTPQFGSYLFLGELLTNLELEPDKPLSGDPCTECQLCVQACPTHALLPNRSVDARRCLSYWTIEHRGTVPKELRPLLENRIFGCDTCQMVCPFNSQVATTKFTYAQSPIISPFTDLLNEFVLTQSEWQAKYGQTPVSRVKYAGFKRNLTYALGNAHNPRAASALLQELAINSDSVVQDACTWALQQLI